MSVEMKTLTINDTTFEIVDSKGRSSIENKADKATTLSGYGITDTYTKTQVNELFDSAGIVVSEPEKLIEMWGDSLTQGNQDGTGVSTQSVLSELLGGDWVIKNYGAGGEQSNTIACRQGGMFAVCKPGVTIPATITPVEVQLVDQNGDAVNFRSGTISSAHNTWETINPCSIAGVKGNLTRIGSAYSTTSWNFTRLAEGAQVEINRPVNVITNAMSNQTKPVLIIWMGQNNGYQSDDSILCKQIRQMIEHAKTDRYMIVGFHVANSNRTFEDAMTTNSVLQREFGKHFINLYQYMTAPIKTGNQIISCYALDDFGITPSTSDITALNNGYVPPTLLADDSIHLSQYGYRCLANLEYQRGNDLGYWVATISSGGDPSDPGEVTDTIVFPPTSDWEFTKMMEQSDSNYTIGTCEYTGDTFTGSFSGYNMGVGIRSKDKISFSGFNTLHVEFSSSELQSGSQFNVYVQNTISTAGDVIDHVATSSELAAGVIDIDVSSISGSYYIVIGAIAWYNRNVNITISKVGLNV